MSAQDIKELQEQLALQRHINQYAYFADTKQWKEISECLSEDTVFEFKVAEDVENKARLKLASGSINGRQAAGQALASISQEFEKTQHNIVNCDFDIEFSSQVTATGKANIIWAGVRDSKRRYLTVMTGNMYTWKFAKIDGRWQTTYTQVECLWESTVPGA